MRRRCNQSCSTSSGGVDLTAIKPGDSCNWRRRMNFFTSTCLSALPALHCIAPPPTCNLPALHTIVQPTTQKHQLFCIARLQNQKTSTFLIHRVMCHYCSVQGDFRSRERRKMTSGNKRNVRPWAPSVLYACHCQCRKYINFPLSNERRFEFNKISFGLTPPFWVGRLRN